MILPIMMNIEKLEAWEHYLKSLIRRDNYIECKSKGDRYENLTRKEYLKMIRPYLRDLIKMDQIDGSNDDDDDDDDDDVQ